MANKRANHKTPKSGQGPIQIRTKDGTYSTTTWPFQRKNKNGAQMPVPGIMVKGSWLFDNGFKGGLRPTNAPNAS